MPIYYVIIVVMLGVFIVSLLLNLLTNPIVWLIIAALFIYSLIRRYLYMKQLEDYNRQWKKKTEEKKKAYQAREDYQSGKGDVIDVDYKEFDDDNH